MPKTRNITQLLVSLAFGYTMAPIIFVALFVFGLPILIALFSAIVFSLAIAALVYRSGICAGNPRGILLYPLGLLLAAGINAVNLLALAYLLSPCQSPPSLRAVGLIVLFALNIGILVLIKRRVIRRGNPFAFFFVLYFLLAFSSFALISGSVSCPAQILGTACITVQGYSCTNPSLSPNGVLTFTLCQCTGATIYNAFITVAGKGSTLNEMGFPEQGAVFPPNAIGITPFYSGSTKTVQIQLTTNQTQMPGFVIGQAFVGYIWLNYSSSNTSPADVSDKAAIIAIKVS